jgi:class 3 adenylate cyclase
MRHTELPNPADGTLPASDYPAPARLDHWALRSSQPDAKTLLGFLRESLDHVNDVQPQFGRSLDRLGMVYAAKDNYLIAQELFEEAIEVQNRTGDRSGMGVSHGHLGQLLLNWGELDRAEEQLRQYLELVDQQQDVRGTAQVYNHLGEICFQRNRFTESLEYVTKSIELNQAIGFAIGEGYARNDRALVHLELGDVLAANREAEHAATIFREARCPRGLALTESVRGRILTVEGNATEASELLQRAAEFFDSQKDHLEAARAWREVARCQKRVMGSPTAGVDALKRALDRAERSGRGGLVAAIATELRAADRSEYDRRIFQRARGRDISEETNSLSMAIREEATVMILDLQDYTGFVRSEDPAAVMRTLNQLFADFQEILEVEGVTVNQYVGDGLMAFARGPQHALRMVEAALKLTEQMDEFNQPHRLLEHRDLQLRIGICTGDVVFGNVGTYGKMDFTAVGRPSNLAARLESVAISGTVCVCAETYKLVQHKFVGTPDSPRFETLKGFGRQAFWDILGRSDA